MVYAGQLLVAVVGGDAAAVVGELAGEVVLGIVVAGMLDAVLLAPLVDGLRVVLAEQVQNRAVGEQADAAGLGAVEEQERQVGPEVAARPLPIGVGDAFIPGEARSAAEELRLVREDARDPLAEMLAEMAVVDLVGQLDEALGDLGVEQIAVGLAGPPAGLAHVEAAEEEALLVLRGRGLGKGDLSQLAERRPIALFDDIGGLRLALGLVEGRFADGNVVGLQVCLAVLVLGCGHLAAGVARGPEVLVVEPQKAVPAAGDLDGGSHRSKPLLAQVVGREAGP